ncbi:MAG: HlyD family efflux transporter periplasmic adaptor subunit [bacterium]|nr:HlyD family efflux transporter periplasmic adaptor subunit [bacterium]
MPHPRETAEPAPDTATAPRAATAVLLVGITEETVSTLRSAAGDELDLAVPEDLDQVWQALTQRQFGVLCLGGGLDGRQSRGFLEKLYDDQPEYASVNLVLNAGPDLKAFEDLILDERIYYLAQRPPGAAEVTALVRNAARRYLESTGGEPDSAPRQGTAQPAREGTLVDLLRRIAIQDDAADIAELVIEGARGAVQTDRVYCLLYDPVEEILWARDPSSLEKREESPAVGLVSFVLRSGLPVIEERIGQNPRYDPEADDPLGTGRERFLAVPIASSDRTVAVLAVVRDGAQPPFDAGELHRLERLAAQAAPYLAAQLPSGAQSVVAGQSGFQEGLYRSAATTPSDGRDEAQPDPLRISPMWSRISYWLLVAALVTFLVYSLIGKIDEYATGIAIVRITGRTDVTALTAGTVTAVEVSPGQLVEAGQVLVRLNDERESAELERIEREFRLQLIKRLRDPTDASAEQALISQRAQRELAKARFEERHLRAPVDATISEIRVRPGQYLLPGHILLTLAGEETTPSIIVLLPGQYRPQLEPGMPLRLEISGYRYAYQNLEVESVADEVISPAEAHRLLGPGISDAVDLRGPTVVVEARLPSQTFEAEGQTYSYHNGMHCAAEVRLRSETILVTLVPALKRLLRQADG